MFSCGSSHTVFLLLFGILFHLALKALLVYNSTIRANLFIFGFHFSIVFILVCRHTKQSVVAYVGDYFTTQTLREIYAGEVMPIPIPEEWCVPNEVSSRIVATPANTRQAGRPRQNRMSAGSGSRSSGSKFCGRCFQRGHYQNTCKAYIDLEFSVEEASTSQPVNTIKRRRPKTCGICHVSGHTRQTCSQRPVQEEAQ